LAVESGELNQRLPKIIAVHETIVSKNNRFLVAIGIVQGGKKKTITTIGTELAHALQHDIAEEVAAKWRAIVDATDFLQKVVAAVRIRKSMDESSLESHVAYSAGQPKTPAIAAGAGAVVEILKTAGLLKEEGGNLVAAAVDALKIPETVQQSISASESTSVETASVVGLVPASAEIARTPGGVQLSIEVKVQCTPADLDGLGVKLRKVLADFNRSPEPEEKSDGASASVPNNAKDAEQG
jgi:hypothetical protein